PDCRCRARSRARSMSRDWPKSADRSANPFQPFDGGKSRPEAQMSDNTGDGVHRRYIKRQTAQARAYSQAVITEGGSTVWLAGQVGAADASRASLAGDFDGQVR